MSERRAWAIVTKSRGGVVSILRDLTLDECRQAWERLDTRYGQTVKTYRVQGRQGGLSFNGMRMCLDSDIELREVIGPADWDASEMNKWPRWPQYEDVYVSEAEYESMAADD